MTTARQHHFQGQFYLRGFANGNDQVRLFDLDSNRDIGPTNVRNVAGQRDLYRFGDDEVESDLARLVDGPAAGLLPRLILSFPPSPDDRAQFERYFLNRWSRGISA